MKTIGLLALSLIFSATAYAGKEANLGQIYLVNIEQAKAGDSEAMMALIVPIRQCTEAWYLDDDHMKIVREHGGDGAFRADFERRFAKRGLRLKQCEPLTSEQLMTDAWIPNNKYQAMHLDLPILTYWFDKAARLEHPYATLARLADLPLQDQKIAILLNEVGVVDLFTGSLAGGFHFARAMEPFKNIAYYQWRYLGCKRDAFCDEKSLLKGYDHISKWELAEIKSFNGDFDFVALQKEVPHSFQYSDEQINLYIKYLEETGQTDIVGPGARDHLIETISSRMVPEDSGLLTEIMPATAND